MRFVKAVLLGLVFWFVATLILGMIWSLAGLPYNPEYSNLINLMLLPAGLYFGWRVTRPDASQ